MALRVEVGIERMFKRARGIVRNDSCGSFVGNGIADVICIIGRVGNHELGGLAVEKCRGLWSVTSMASRENESYRTAKSSHGQMNFGAQAAARTSDGLILSPPFAPLAC